MSEIKIGNDIVFLPRFRTKFEKISKKVYSKNELKEKSMEKLAGIFALKESCLKALGLSPGSWLSIEVKRASSGKPQITLERDIGKKIVSQDCSLSHDGDYVIAQVAFLLKKED